MKITTDEHCKHIDDFVYQTLIYAYGDEHKRAAILSTIDMVVSGIALRVAKNGKTEETAIDFLETILESKKTEYMNGGEVDVRG